jgi:ADP-ribose pyrophosphatase YjhB (NUDIX family)
MEISAGILIVQQNRILLAHPTNAPWYGTYTIPKGKLEGDENPLEAALRETYEEVGVRISVEDIKNKKKPYIIEYKNQQGNIYKILYWFVAEPKKEVVIDKSRLQKREVNWAGFLDKDEAMSRIFWRFEEMIKFIK